MRTSTIFIWIISLAVAFLTVASIYTITTSRSLQHQQHQISKNQTEINGLLVRQVQVADALCSTAKSTQKSIDKISDIAVTNIMKRASLQSGKAKQVTLSGVPLWTNLKSSFKAPKDC